jgi:hypothetical protein
MARGLNRTGRYIPKFQSGGYMGDIAMQGEASVDVRKLIAAAKEKEAEYQKAKSKRGFWSGLSDVFETGLRFIPGVGKVAASALDVLSEQAIQSLIPVEGGPDLEEFETMWTGGEATAGQEEWEKIYGASDVSFGESLMRGAKSFMGSELGGKFMGGVGDKLGFTKLGKQLGFGGESGFNELLAMGKEGEVISPEGSFP